MSDTGLFIYTRKSESKILREVDSPYVARVTWANGHHHVLGGYNLFVRVPDQHRETTQRWAIAVVEALGGVAYRRLDTIGVVVPKHRIENAVSLMGLTKFLGGSRHLATEALWEAGASVFSWPLGQAIPSFQAVNGERKRITLEWAEAGDRYVLTARATAEGRIKPFQHNGEPINALLINTIPDRVVSSVKAPANQGAYPPDIFGGVAPGWNQFVDGEPVGLIERDALTQAAVNFTLTTRATHGEDASNLIDQDENTLRADFNSRHRPLLSTIIDRLPSRPETFERFVQLLLTATDPRTAPATPKTTEALQEEQTGALQEEQPEALQPETRDNGAVIMEWIRELHRAHPPCFTGHRIIQDSNDWADFVARTVSAGQLSGLKSWARVPTETLSIFNETYRRPIQEVQTILERALLPLALSRAGLPREGDPPL